MTVPHLDYEPKRPATPLKTVPVVGCIVGFVLTLMAAWLIAMILPSLGSSRERAREAQALVTMREILMSVNLYAIEYDNNLPPHLAAAVIWKGNSRMLRDPRTGRPPIVLPLPALKDWSTIAAAVDAQSDFGYLGAGLNLHDIAHESDTLLVYAKLPTRSGDRFVGFADGHSERVPPAALPPLLEQLNKERKARELPPLPLTLP